MSIWPEYRKITVQKANPASSTLYDKRYYLNHRGGSHEFQKSKGKILYAQHKFALELAKLKFNDRVLDLGCGCGEVALNAALFSKSVLAIDYSQDAIDLALEARNGFQPEIQGKIKFLKADFNEMTFPSGYFDVTFFLDVIEHLTPKQIGHALGSIYRSLRPGGRVIVHTWPNRWHRQLTYPVSCYLGKFLKQERPRNPRTTHEELMHLSEQSPYGLRNHLKKAGFQTKVFLHFTKSNSTSYYEQVYDVFHSAFPLKWFFCDHIWGIGIK